MATITFTDASGQNRVIDARVGQSVMQAARAADIPGIIAECGGACACGTCHVYVEPDWMARVGPQNEMEASLLEYAEAAASNSRLSCQIQVSEMLDGLKVTTPETQG